MRFIEFVGGGGLILPAREQPKAKPAYNPHPLQIKDPDLREQAKMGLTQLWHAMELSASFALDKTQREAHKRAWNEMADMLLGDDAPEFEVLT